MTLWTAGFELDRGLRGGAAAFGTQHARTHK